MTLSDLGLRNSVDSRITALDICHAYTNFTHAFPIDYRILQRRRIYFVHALPH
jgi:hypothetical protein